MGKIKVELNKDDGKVIYSISNGKFIVRMDCNDDGTVLIRGPKELMAKAIGGRGDENETEAWFTEKNCKTQAELVSNIAEVIDVLTSY